MREADASRQGEGAVVPDHIGRTGPQLADLPASFVRLEACEQPTCFRLPVTDDLCVGPAGQRFLFGGAGLGAALSAMEQVTGRPPVYASAQFLSFARPGETLSLDVRTLAAGRQTSQALVVATVDGRAVLSVAGALGARTSDSSGVWVRPPRVPDPDSCPLVRHWRGDDGIHAGLDIRVAKGRYGADQVGAPEMDGRMILWARPRGDVAIDVPFLAVLADLVPGGIGNALGDDIGGNSLDNVLRIVSVRPTRWVLVDVAIAAIEAGVAHGTVTLSTDGGIVMALGSQSIIVRPRRHLGAVGKAGRSDP